MFYPTVNGFSNAKRRRFSEFTFSALAVTCPRAQQCNGMQWKRNVSGSVLGVIGFLLSPLSWWNDAFVNLPLAIGFAWVIALFYKPAFEASVVIGYWLTNVLGFVLMHKGAGRMLSEEERRYTWRHGLKDVLISLAYTAVIVVLLQTKLPRPIENYFPGKQ